MQQTPVNICDVFDMYTNNGDSRLTFLCQIRPTRERRSKSIKYSIIAQLIELVRLFDGDVCCSYSLNFSSPSMRDQYMEYVDEKSEVNSSYIKVEQVNLGAH